VSDQSQTPESAPEPATEQITEAPSAEAPVADEAQASAEAPVAAEPAVPTAPAPPPEPPVAIPPLPPGSSAEATVTERPEVAVAAAFAGGIALATILKRLGR
jgi:hypothetical protein